MRYKFMLDSAVQQSESALSVHISPSLLSLPSTPPQPLLVITEYLAKLPVMQQLHTGYFMYGSAYTSALLSQFISPPLPPPSIHSLHLQLFSCLQTKLSCTIF